MTTATAFGSLWLSSHPGTSSMGQLMALALVSTMMAAVLFQPALMGPPRDVAAEAPAPQPAALEPALPAAASWAVERVAPSPRRAPPARVVRVEKAQQDQAVADEVEH
jgi:hypothetical protein